MDRKETGFLIPKDLGYWIYVKCLECAKRELKSDKYLFVGYPRETKIYYFYHPQENKLFIALHAIFLEKEFLNAVVSGRKIELNENRSDTIPDIESSTEHEQFIRDEAVPHLQLHKDRVGRRESGNNQRGMGF